MMTIDRQRIAVRSGEPAPPSYGMTQQHAFYSFEDQAGRSAALILAGSLPLPAISTLIDAFQRRAGDFARLEADILLLVEAQSSHALDYSTQALQGVQVVYCEPEVFKRWGLDGREPAVVTIDRSIRVISSIEGPDEDAVVAEALYCIASVPIESARDILLPAPVLLIPNVFAPTFCRELIKHFEGSPHAAGGMASVDARGNPIHKIDEGKKRRFDFVLHPGDLFYGRVLEALIRICLPEMKKAFHFDACHTDRILIARYDDTGGYFRRHRDNVAPSVSFRQFALSVNLNSDEYEGGYLQFPEYSSHRYRPGRGAGIIFSSSLLHEATPVTKGQRYVLLTFFHNEDAQARWLGSSSPRN